MTTAYQYFVHDNASFRSSREWPLASAEEVLVRGEWVPYSGDPLEPVVFGNHVEEDAALRYNIKK